MSNSESDLPDATGGIEPDEIDAMIGQLDGAIESINKKIEGGRIRDPETEKVRIKYYRTLGYLIRTKRKLVEDKTLAELSEEVAALKEAREAGGGGGSSSGSGSDEVEFTLGER